MTILESLKQYFGFDGFRAGQEKVITSLLNGHSSLAVFPTGSGKSLCYQLPALHFPGLTVVISPLIALMKDQIDFLHSKGIPAAKIDSSLSYEEVKTVWQGIENGSLKLLYIAPERLANEKFLQRLQKSRISMMVVDEAHCMSEWGHNFRPDYLKLPQVAQALQAERVLALTATATPAVAQNICQLFSIAAESYVNIGYYRPNLKIRLTPIHQEQKQAHLLQRLTSQASGATIIYVTLQKETEDLASFLRAHHFKALSYHAGMKSEDRTAIQEEFMNSKDSIVVATIAFGMGIDKSDIRYVYHYNLPKSMENYSQEIGRAGRDGQASVCEVLACDSDRIVLENFTYGDTPTLESIESLLQELLHQGPQFDISSYELSHQHDMRPLVISTLLCYLELQNIIQSTGPFYNSYKVKFLSSKEQILARFDTDRQYFLQGLFNSGKQGPTWLSIDIDQAVQNLKQDRSRITKALNYLDDQNLISTQVTGLRLGYRLLQEQVDISSLAQQLFLRFSESEKRDIERSHSFVELTRANHCIVRSVLSYFGEDLGKDCGHCDRCLKEYQGAGHVETMRSSLNSEEEKIALQVRQESHPALLLPRQIAKFLCGINSPKGSRSRPSLSKHRHFGSLGHLPFQSILRHLEK